MIGAEKFRENAESSSIRRACRNAFMLKAAKCADVGVKFGVSVSVVGIWGLYWGLLSGIIIDTTWRGRGGQWKEGTGAC